MSGRLARLYRGETKVDFIGRRKIWFAISALVLVASAVALLTRPTSNPCRSPLPSGLNCGIEFNGGLSITAPIPQRGPLGDAQDLEIISSIGDALRPLGASDAQVQVERSEDERRVLVQTRRVSDPAARQELVDAVGNATGASSADIASESISAKWGGEITDKAIRALIVFLVVILVFISWRFEWKMALAAIAALFHDLLITAGVYSIVGFEVTPSTVIAILTILGYSLYDTVVVFDKVEENTAMLAATGRATYEDAANLAMNQVFMRSLNTSLATLLPVAALLFVGAGLLGAGTLEDLALALLVGILSGTYSSIFFATPILAVLKEREPKYRNVREKVLRDAKRAAARPSLAPVPATVGAPADEPKVAGGRAPSSGGSKRPGPTTTKPRPGSKKARRRRKR
jgi:preprotein translocase subunit SecF